MPRKVLLVFCLGVLLTTNLCAREITLVKYAKRKQASGAVDYTIKTGDTMWKIMMNSFDAKPEDLPSLYREFRRLNPNIKDLDRIRIGQKVKVPSLQDVAEKRAADSDRSEDVYVMRKGEYLAKVLRDVYGLSNEEIFDKYLGKIRKLNPEIENLDYIQAGQKVKMPDFAARAVEKTEPKKMPAVTRPPQIEELEVVSEEKSPVEPEAQAPEKKTEQVDVLPQKEVVAVVAPRAEAPKIEPPEPEEEKLPEPAPPVKAAAPAPVAQKKEAVPATPSVKAMEEEQAAQRRAAILVKNTLVPAVADMGGAVRNEGTFFMPLAGGSISIDTAQIPVMDLDTGRRIILDIDGRNSPEIRQVIEDSFPACKVVSGPIDSPEEMVEKILGVSGYFSVNRDAAPLLVGEEEKVSFSGKWIVYKDFSRRNVFVVNLLKKDEEKTPECIRSYAARFGIDLVEIGGQTAEIEEPRHDYIRDVNHSVAGLFDGLGIGCRKDVEIVLVSQEPVRLAYKAPLMVGKTIFAAEQPDDTMLALLKQKGYVLVDTRTARPQDILKLAGIGFAGPPVRIELPNGKTSVDIPGMRVGGTIVLSRPIDRDITRYIASTGADILVW